MTTITDKLGREHARTYLEARRRGETPVSAHFRVQTERACSAVLSWTNPDSVDDEAASHFYNDPVDAYEVDTDALRRHTAGPLRHVVRPDGTHPDGTVDLGDATAWLIVYADDHDHLHDAECYSAEDRAAHARGAWEFVGIQAVVVLPDGRVGTGALWGIEQGPHWPGSDLADVWHAVPDVLAEAYTAATEAKIPAPTGHCATCTCTD